MTSVEELEHMLYVEELHTRNFAGWAKRATDPVARLAFQIAADKEANHVAWVNLMLEIARTKKMGKDIGVTRFDLEFWVADEGGESESYRQVVETASEPWVRAAVRQMQEDERTNAELLQLVLDHARSRATA